TVQNAPSSHGAVLNVCWQVPELSQVSSVHGFPSSVHGVPAGAAHVSAVSSQVLLQTPTHGVPVWLQVPPPHDSVPLQKTPSSQVFELAGCVHEMSVPSHTSVVQTLPSLVHGVLLGCTLSAAQFLVVPSQRSIASHTPALPRQTVVVGATLSTGHVAAVPLQVSAVSQIPAALRQTIVAENESAGQNGAVPLQRSTASQTPFEPRQISVVPANVSAGQLSDVPVHVSDVSQMPLAERQIDVLRELAGHDALAPLQTSAVSQTPADSRHSVPVRKPSTGHDLAVPLQLSLVSQTPFADRHST